MKNRSLIKAIAMALVITLTFANITIIESLVQEVYAAQEEVTFEANIKNAQGEEKKETTSQISEQLKLCLKIKTREGYLENAQINLKNANFKLINNIEETQEIKEIDTENGIIYLNQINKNEEKEIEIPIELKQEEQYQIRNTNQETEIELEAKQMTSKGKKEDIKITEKVKIELTTKAKATLTQEISKVVEFETEEEKGLLIQSIIKTGIEQNEAPIEQTTLNITVPEIKGQKPQEVKVYANSTKATNGLNAEEFTQENYKYDGTNITITVNNKQNKEGKVSWTKNTQDEYAITYIYTEEIAKQIKEQKQTIEQKAKVEIKTYTNQEIEKQTNQSFEIQENTSKTVNTKIGVNTSTINKGYLYNQKEQETTYNTYYITDIAYTKLVDEITIEAKKDKLITQNQEEIQKENTTYFKQTTIEKANFDKILGEEGQITILNENQEEIAKINKDTENKNGKYTINYETPQKQITIKTTKPKTEGKLQIENQKAIKANQTTQEEIKQIKNIKMEIETKATKQITTQKAQEQTNTNTENQEKNTTKTTQNITTSEETTEGTINLEEPTTQIETNISQTTLSTVTKNENVELNVILKTNNNTCQLFENPQITIELPTYIEDIEIKDQNILFDDELKIKNTKVEETTNGNKTITIQIEGKQTKYNTSELVEGTKIQITADIKVKENTPTKEEKIKTTITNKEETKQSETTIKFIAPPGLVTVSTMDLNGETAISISGRETTGKIEAQAGQQTGTVKLTIINNYANKLENIQILGRTPFAGNKTISTNQDLGSTFTANLISKITAVSGIAEENIEIYYTENEEADKDLNKATNNESL